MLALSVSISTSSSPREISSPSDLSHLRIVPSSIESDRRGIATSAMAGMYRSGEGGRMQIEAERELEVMLGQQRLVGQDLGARPVGDHAARGEDHGALAQLGGE